MIKMCWNQKSNKKVFHVKLILNFSYTKHYKTCWHIVWSAKKKKKNTKNVGWKLLKTKNGKTVLSLKCSACYSKKSKISERKRSKRNVK